MILVLTNLVLVQKIGFITTKLNTDGIKKVISKSMIRCQWGLFIMAVGLVSFFTVTVVYTHVLLSLPLLLYKPCNMHWQAVRSRLPMY